jgi:hypothetical protein
VIEALDAAWAKIRQADRSVPAVTFELQPGRSSSCGTVEWDVSPHLVLNLKDESGESLSGREILKTLLHHGAHAAALGSTGAEGRYHSAQFAEAARLLGLTVSQDRIPGIGYAPDGLARGTLTRYEPEIRALDKALASWQPETLRKRDRGPQTYVCSCDPPRRLRMNTGQADKGPVTCGICGQDYRFISAS